MRAEVFFKDIASALRAHELITYRAMSEIKARYKRTVIGPFWTTLSMAIFIIAFGVLGSRLWATDVASYMPFFCSGYLAWTLISTIINESKVVFVNNKEILNSTAIPMHVFVFELILRNYIVFIHHMVVYAGVLVFFAYPVGWTILLMLPGFFIAFLASVSFVSIWGVACTRYRDLGQLSGNILQIIFFLTPIMWSPDTLTGKTRLFLVDLNPMHHFIEIIRAPMLGKVPSMFSYAFTIGVCAGLFFLAVYILERFRHRIVFWL